MPRRIKFVAAIDDKNGLARGGKLPWNLPSDREFFRKAITDGVGLMGWNTFASNRKKPFPTSPRNVVVTDRREQYEGVEMIDDLQKFINETTEDICVIGGGDIFSQLLPQATHLYITRVSGDFMCDVFFPNFEDTFKLVSKSKTMNENETDFRYELWEPK